MNEFDKELDNALRLLDNDAWFVKDPKYLQAKEAIKQAIEKHVIGEPLGLAEATNLIQNEKLGKLIRSGSLITIDQQRTRINLK